MSMSLKNWQLQFLNYSEYSFLQFSFLTFLRCRIFKLKGFLLNSVNHYSWWSFSRTLNRITLKSRSRKVENCTQNYSWDKKRRKDFC